MESLKEGMALVADGALVDGGARPEVAARHFQAALRQVQPSVSRKDQRMYDALRFKLRSSRSHLRKDEDAPVTAMDGPC